MNTYLVGGAVRDKLLKLAVAERDWVVVGATPEYMLAQGFKQVGRDFPVYLHPESGEEYALARTERKTGPGHTGFACNSDPTITLEEDLNRRDLTINAMAEDAAGTIIDPYGGQADLEQRLLRHVSDAFVEDPLRVLRVARFAARFSNMGFTVAPETLALMRSIAAGGELTLLAAERIWSELEKSLAADSPAAFLDTLENCAALDQILPGLNQHPERRAVLAAASRHSEDPLLRYAVLFESFPIELAEGLNEHLRAPRKYADLALLCSRYGGNFVEAEILDPEQTVLLLELTDAFRRPRRFAQFLEACELAQAQAYGSRDHLQRAFEACRDLKPGLWAKDELKGHEIGERLRAERIQKVAAIGG